MSGAQLHCCQPSSVVGIAEPRFTTACGPAGVVAMWVRPGSPLLDCLGSLVQSIGTQWLLPCALLAGFTAKYARQQYRHATLLRPSGTNRRPGVGVWGVSHCPSSPESAPARPGGARLHVWARTSSRRTRSSEKTRPWSHCRTGRLRPKTHRTGLCRCPWPLNDPKASPPPVVVHPRHTKCLFHAVLPGTSHGVEGKDYGAVCAKN